MKNSKSMFGLAKAKAIDYGPRQYGKCAGFYLTKTELKTLFIEEGFNVSRPTMNNYIGVWRELNYVYAVKQDGFDEPVFFFLLNDTEDGRFIFAAERAYPTLHWWSGVKAVMS